MFATSKSAVFRALRCRVLKVVKARKINTMSNWQEEKEKFLSMDINKKRDLCKKFVTLDKIPTWKQYASGKTLLPKTEMNTGLEIDPSKNAALADKISLFFEDITTLEVSGFYIQLYLFYIYFCQCNTLIIFPPLLSIFPPFSCFLRLMP